MKHLGAGEACRAHNPEVRRSKLRGATFSFAVLLESMLSRVVGARVSIQSIVVYGG